MKKQRIRLPRRDGLVGEWLLNGNTKDTSGNGNNWTPTNVTYSKTDRGYQTYAGNFNGSNSKVDVSNSLWLTNNFTVMTWAQTRQNWDTDWVLWSQYNSILLFAWNVGAYYYDGSWDRSVSGNTIVSDSNLHFIVWTKSSTEWQKIYLDWKLDWTNPTYNSNLSTSYTSLPWIGYFRTFNANYNNWKQQSVRVFNRVLSADEIRDWYLEGLRALGGSSLSGLMDGLVAYYDFRWDANDIVGWYNGTVTWATLTTDRFWNTNWAYSFSWNNSDSISKTWVALPLTNYSIHVWINTASIPSWSDFGEILWLFNSSSQYVFWLMIYQWKYYTLQWVWWANWVVNPSSPLPTTWTWELLSVIWWWTSITIYRNWVQIWTWWNWTFSATVDNVRVWLWKYVGKIGELTILNRAHSADEVKAVYELSKQYKLLPFA